jgi:hypothetical protein
MLSGWAQEGLRVVLCGWIFADGFFEVGMILLEVLIDVI